MLTKVHAWLQPPQSISEDKKHIANIVHLILLTLFFTSAGVAISRIMAGFYITAVTLLVGTAVIAVCLWLNRKGHTNAASILVILVLIILVATLQVIGQGMHDIVIIVYPIIAIIISLLLDQLLYFLLIGLTIFTIGIVTYLDINGLTNSLFGNYTAMADFAIISTIFLITAVAMRQIIKNWNHNLVLARHNAKELTHKAHDLQISENRYHSIFENSPIALWEDDFSHIKKYLSQLTHTSNEDIIQQLYDDPQVILHCAQRIIVLDVNQATLSLFKASSKEHLIANLHRIFGPNAYELLRDAIIALLTENTPFIQEINMRTLQKEDLHVIYHLVVAPENKDNWARVFVSVQDITAQKMAQKALEKSEYEALRFQKKLHTLHDVSIGLSRTLTLENLYRDTITLGREKLGFDRLGLLLWDQTTDKMVGTYGTDTNGRLRDESYFQQKINNPEYIDILKQKKRLGFWQDITLIDNGEVVGQGWHAMSVLWNGDEGIGWLAADNLIKKESPTQEQLDLLVLYGATVGHFITLKQIEADREKLIKELETKNAELERFTYTVSHDLKSPLVTVQGFLGYLEKDAAAGNMERLQRDIQYIREASTHMQSLLNDLLELSRIGRLMNEPQTVPFADLAHDAIKQVSGAITQKQIAVEIQPNMPAVHVDRVRLVEVLQNLIDNAVKFMGDQQTPHIVIGYRQENNQPIFFVRDNGVGIDTRYHDKVFGLFERLDATAEGTGIGLALVKRIIEVHNGRIWIENNHHIGTTFCFTLGSAPEITKVNLIK